MQRNHRGPHEREVGGSEARRKELTEAEVVGRGGEKERLGFEDAVLLPLEMEGATSQGCSSKGKEVDYPLVPPEGV